LAAALVALAGSLYLSLGMGLKACPLCFYQRAFAMSLVAVLGMGVLTGAGQSGRLGLLSVPLAAAGLGVALAPGLCAPGSAPEGGPHPARPCLLDLTDCYLPAVDSSRRAALLAAVPFRPLAEWTLLQRHGTVDRLERHWYGFGPAGEANRAGFLRWLRTTPCDTLVFLDRLPGGSWEDVPDVALHAELRDLVLAQREFRLVQERAFPRHGCRVMVWRRE
jgi:disulfide bond formation protein DsbB